MPYPEIKELVLKSAPLIPKCPDCAAGNISLIDMLSIEEKSWNLPVWGCFACNLVFTGRSKDLESIMKNNSQVQIKAFREKAMKGTKVEVDIKDINDVKKWDPINQLEKDVLHFRLK